MMATEQDVKLHWYARSEQAECIFQVLDHEQVERPYANEGRWCDAQIISRRCLAQWPGRT